MRPCCAVRPSCLGTHAARPLRPRARHWADAQQHSQFGLPRLIAGRSRLARHATPPRPSRADAPPVATLPSGCHRAESAVAATDPFALRLIPNCVGCRHAFLSGLALLHMALSALRPLFTIPYLRMRMQLQGSVKINPIYPTPSHTSRRPPSDFSLCSRCALPLCSLTASRAPSAVDRCPA